MKITLIPILFILTISTLRAQCNEKEIIKAGKANLKPFSYQYYEATKFKITNQEQVIKGVFPIDEDEDERYVFIKDPNIKEAVQVNIFNKPDTAPDRSRLYHDSLGINNTFWMFTINKKGKMYVEYTIPASVDGKSKEGCIYYFVGL
jgi:hypothetical protein